MKRLKGEKKESGNIYTFFIITAFSIQKYVCPILVIPVIIAIHMDIIISLPH